MIHAHLLAKHAPQPSCKLRSQCNFRNQIKHLFPCRQYLFYQRHIHLGFTARSNPVQQTHILFLERAVNFVEGMLFLGQLLTFPQPLSLLLAQFVCRKFQAAGHKIISCQHTFFSQGTQSRIRRSLLITQCLTRHLRQKLRIIQIQRSLCLSQVQVTEQQSLLRWGTTQSIEQSVQFFL